MAQHAIPILHDLGVDTTTPKLRAALRRFELAMGGALPTRTGLRHTPLVSRELKEEASCAVCQTKLKAGALVFCDGGDAWIACEQCVAIDEKRRLRERVLASLAPRAAPLTSSSRHVGTIKFRGVYRDDVRSRTLPRCHGRRRLRVAVHTLIREMVQRGVKTCHIGLQDGNEVWSDLLADSEPVTPFDRLGRTGDVPRARSSGRTKLAIRVPPIVGAFHTTGGGHENAVYELSLFTLDAAVVSRSLIACGADFDATDHTTIEASMRLRCDAVVCERALDCAKLDPNLAVELVPHQREAPVTSLAELLELLLSVHCARRVDACDAATRLGVGPGLGLPVIMWQLTSLRQESEETCGFYALWNAMALLGASAKIQGGDESMKGGEALPRLVRMVSGSSFQSWFKHTQAKVVEWVEGDRPNGSLSSAPPLKRSNSSRKGQLTREGAALLLMNDPSLSGLVASGALTLLADVDTLPSLPTEWELADTESAAARALSSSLGDAFDVSACLSALRRSGKANAAALLLLDSASVLHSSEAGGGGGGGGGGAAAATSTPARRRRRGVSVTSIFELDRTLARLRRELSKGCCVSHSFVLGTWNHWITVVVSSGAAADGSARLELLLLESENKPCLSSIGELSAEDKVKHRRLAAIHTQLTMIAVALGVRLGKKQQQVKVSQDQDQDQIVDDVREYISCAAYKTTASLQNFAKLPWPRSKARAAIADAGAIREKKEETRVSDDGGMYTQSQFVEHFGGTAEWDAAETRKSEDGFQYTKAGFMKHFGGTAEWDAAAARLPQSEVEKIVALADAAYQEFSDDRQGAYDEVKKARTEMEALTIVNKLRGAPPPPIAAAEVSTDDAPSLPLDIAVLDEMAVDGKVVYDAFDIITLLLALSVQQEPPPAWVPAAEDDSHSALAAALIAVAGLVDDVSGSLVKRVMPFISGRCGLYAILQASGMDVRSPESIAEWHGACADGAIDGALLEELTACVSRAVNTIAAEMAPSGDVGASSGDARETTPPPRKAAVLLHRDHSGALELQRLDEALRLLLVFMGRTDCIPTSTIIWPAPVGWMQRARDLAKASGSLLEVGDVAAAVEAAIALQPATPIDVVFDALGAIVDMEVETRWKCTVCIANGDDRGRLRKAKRPRNRCNNCEKRGCDYRCPVKKHDFDLCTSCWEKIAGPLAVAILHSVQQQFSG